MQHDATRHHPAMRLDRRGALLLAKVVLCMQEHLPTCAGPRARSVGEAVNPSSPPCDQRDCGEDLQEENQQHVAQKCAHDSNVGFSVARPLGQ